ncbi:TrkA C-terminal domain-containing protein [Campylobacter sp. CX2-8023-23]|uniref:TrkA C-terminal domain-containing protein n=1 Tax=Campylobacter porcelli TaxID=1660073 RepID=A0ABU7M2E2_9BACT|nr:TrkA C-terminal domain-containing protein [Campylobacter sp. CX2-8023-23]MEE3743874.1 TrkA C-terminal domain-containing protein [Campylobacter sp. CX2-4855-23]
MKNILIIADGILAKNFLERLFNSKNNALHNYTVITYNEETIPSWDVNFENFIFYNFDPTSLGKLKLHLKSEFEQAMVIMQNEFDIKCVCENLRQIYPNLDMDVLDLWGMGRYFSGDNHISIIDARKILSSRFMDFLPDVPVIADNIGMGVGEIMEVQVPNGSSYAYRHVGNIRKKRWKIAMIYRKGSYTIATADDLIMPNDTLLIVGEPRILESVFRAIKKEPGQFPNPFGNNIYLELDMKFMSKNEIDLLIDDTIELHNRLNNKKLFIKVINPTLCSNFSRIKELKSNKIFIDIDYFSTKISINKSKMNELDIGLVITNSKVFNHYKRGFEALKVPILKIGKNGFKILKKGVILGDKTDAESNSSVIMDCCKQLDFSIDFYHFDTKIDNDSKKVIEHFKSLSKIFNKKVNIINDDINPLLKLRNTDDILQFLSFSNKILDNKFGAIFSKDINRLYYILDDNYQLFIPQNDKI